MTESEVWQPQEQVQEPLPVAPPPRGRVLKLTLVAIMFVTLVAATALWITTRSNLSQTQDQLSTVQTQLAGAQSSLASATAKIASDQSVAASKQADLDKVPNLKLVASKYFPKATGDAQSLELTLTGLDLYTSMPTLKRMLTELGFSSAVAERMGLTRALDGTLTAEGKNCNVSWTYHPDDGLRMVFETSV